MVSYGEYLEGKTIAICGPSTSVLDEYGSIEDEIDIYVHLNHHYEYLSKYIPCNIIYHNGIKTNSVSELSKLIEYAKSNGTYLIFPINKFHELYGHDVDYKEYNIYKEFSKLEYSAIVGSKVTTGLCAIMDLLKYNINKLYVIGFDFYKTGYLEGNARKINWPHNCENEERFIANLNDDRLILTDRLRQSIESKKSDVIIVGSGKCILEKPLGSIIDQYNTVVRFSGFENRIDEFSGYKTDIIVINTSREAHDRLLFGSALHLDKKYIITYNGNAINHRKSLVDRLNNMKMILDMYNIEYEEFDICNTSWPDYFCGYGFLGNGKKSISSGLAITDKFLRFEERVTIHGFDFPYYGYINKFCHYYEDDNTLTKYHDLKLESIIINNLIDNNRVIMLDKLERPKPKPARTKINTDVKLGIKRKRVIERPQKTQKPEFKPKPKVTAKIDGIGIFGKRDGNKADPIKKPELVVQFPNTRNRPRVNKAAKPSLQSIKFNERTYNVKSIRFT